MYSNIAERLGRPSQRIAISSALIVILVGLAIGVTLWRFSVSAGRYDKVLASGVTISQTGEARTSLFDVLDAAQRYSANPSTAGKAALASARASVASDLNKVASTNPNTPTEVQALNGARSATVPLDSTVNRLIVLAGTAAASGALNRVSDALSVIDKHLDALVTAEDNDAQTPTPPPRKAQARPS